MVNLVACFPVYFAPDLLDFGVIVPPQVAFNESQPLKPELPIFLHEKALKRYVTRLIVLKHQAAIVFVAHLLHAENLAVL